ncbi:type IV toxin-antitoxin system AbiEi family antitoxin domain-containing protein [Collinsella sp. zg1085]|uniref:type IV toxin-antitoxin system AbiEi family antitoxin domain-containing protein n=1 Tax=Collinsella sp. zg1085 TaxID=2844380 RepID=UPI001C0B00DD|nr:type IV toxin-antitoxin system AbiEi family antitoxin domain-containing protein [Collinsella sp. zg1085]QWT17698.1 type IV toxin-antitoxin system AbiEi family antitoxin domain-containing protein [Collinsella sp. zg1085]
MGVSEQILQLAAQNNGVVTTACLTAQGIHRGNLKTLLNAGKLEQTARGVYILPEVWEDEFINLQARFRKGIFSHETALFLWDLTDLTPHRYSMTFPQGYNLTNAKKERVDARIVKNQWYAIGKTSILSPAGHSVDVYSMERTLCDLLRKRGGADKAILTQAFKRYVARKDKNIPLLSEYAQMFSAALSLRPYLEVLL